MTARRTCVCSGRQQLGEDLQVAQAEPLSDEELGKIENILKGD